MPQATTLEQALRPHGLTLRGHWVPTAADALPSLPGGQAPGVVWMVGVVGSAFWPHFKSSSFFSDGHSDPLDRWSRAMGDALAAQRGGVALYPFEGPPYWPFQRWADRAEATQASRMLLRIHPVYGLWHAYRFALALPAESAASLPMPRSQPMPEPATELCANCETQACLQACPVQAYTGERFVLQACVDHLHSGQGQDCMQSGCLARRACPEGAGLRYSQEHAAFHMRAFAQSH